jgi:NADH-quinone oxidoreductase subunit E
VNELLQKYPEEIRQILNRYPEGQKRSAVMPLLYLAQRQTGQITPQGMAEVAEIVGVSTTDVASIVGFYSLFHEEPGGRFRIQVCTDLPCALRGAESFLEELSQYLGVAVGETTTDGLFTL